jgi:hypothetical protein
MYTFEIWCMLKEDEQIIYVWGRKILRIISEPKK